MRVLAFAVTLVLTGAMLVNQLFSQPIFQTRSEYQCGSDPKAVCAADFDGDGFVDLAVANFESYNITVLMNAGDGSFGPPDSIRVGQSHYHIAAADLDGNSYADIICTNNDSGSISILLNDGGGSFGPHTSYPIGGWPSCIATGPIDNDTLVDFAVSDANSGKIFLFYNNGDSTFTIDSNYQVGESPYAITIVDVNNDGWSELATANRLGNSMSVLYNNGPGGFIGPNTYSAGFSPNSITPGDFNNDGYYDLAVACEGNYNVYVFINNGTGNFSSMHIIENLPRSPVCVYAKDLDSDSADDIIVTSDDCGVVSICYSNSDGTFAQPDRYSAVGAQYCAVADVDDDSFDDIIVSQKWENSVAVLRSNGDGTFAGAHAVVLDHVLTPEPTAITSADLDCDGDIDIAATSMSAYLFAQLLNNGGGRFDSVHIENIEPYPFDIASGDLNNDGIVDFGISYWDWEAQSFTEFSSRLNQVDNCGEFQSWNLQTSNAWLTPAIRFADMNDDGSQDMIILKWSDSVSTMYGNGDGSFGPEYQLYTGMSGGDREFFTCDVNGDSVDDIIVPGNTSDEVAVIINNGDSTFQEAAIYETLVEPVSVWGSDINRDSFIDFAVGHATSDYISIYLNDGFGQFTSAPAVPAGDRSEIVRLADINCDGISDIVASDLYDKIYFMIGNGDGSFQEINRLLTGGTADDINIADYNDDGFPDISVASGPIISLFFHQANCTDVTCGDSNGDDAINIGDVVWIVNYIFKEGPVSDPLCVSDANGDGPINIGDVVHLVNYIFKEGPEPDQNCCP